MHGSTAKTCARATMGKLVVALTLAGVIGGVAVPARADDDWRRHERFEREREWRAHHRRPVHVRPPPPAYIYAPPPVVYAPPPPPSGINLIFPLNFR